MIPKTNLKESIHSCNNSKSLLITIILISAFSNILSDDVASWNYTQRNEIIKFRIFFYKNFKFIYPKNKSVKENYVLIEIRLITNL
jgi:hypothetical protein